MRKRSGREWLNGNTRGNERPGLAELIHDGRGIEPSALRLEESTRRFENLVRGRPSQPCKVRGDDAALGGASRMQRLGHCAKILPQASGFAGPDSERGQYARPIESINLRRGRRGAKRPNGSGAMKSVFVMPRGDCFRDLALHFNPDVVSEQEFLSGDRSDFRPRRAAGSTGAVGWVSKPIDPIFCDGKLGIVVIVSVDANSIGKSRKSHRSLQRRANHRGPMRPGPDTKPLDFR